MPHVFCPTDFSVASHTAFEHALGLTLGLRGRLTLLHVAGGNPHEVSGFPGVRDQLERWGRVPAGSTADAVGELGVTVEKVVGREGDPVSVSLHYLERHPADLIVLNTHQREGRARWLGQAIAEPLAREAHAMTLFLPQGRGGFVSRRDGAVHLERVLIPIAARPAPQRTLDATLELLAGLGVTGVRLTLFHAGAAGDRPAVRFKASPVAPFLEEVTRQGDPVDEILALAEKLSPDLVVMGTDGHQGFLDALRGSTTERVLRKLACPLLAVPANRTSP